MYRFSHGPAPGATDGQASMLVLSIARRGCNEIRTPRRRVWHLRRKVQLKFQEVPPQINMSVGRENVEVVDHSGIILHCCERKQCKRNGADDSAVCRVHKVEQHFNHSAFPLVVDRHLSLREAQVVGPSAICSDADDDTTLKESSQEGRRHNGAITVVCFDNLKGKELSNRNSQQTLANDPVHQTSANFQKGCDKAVPTNDRSGLIHILFGHVVHAAIGTSTWSASDDNDITPPGTEESRNHAVDESVLWVNVVAVRGFPVSELRSTEDGVSSTQRNGVVEWPIGDRDRSYTAVNARGGGGAQRYACPNALVTASREQDSCEYLVERLGQRVTIPSFVTYCITLLRMESVTPEDVFRKVRAEGGFTVTTLKEHVRVQSVVGQFRARIFGSIASIDIPRRVARLRSPDWSDFGWDADTFTELFRSQLSKLHRTEVYLSANGDTPEDCKEWMDGPAHEMLVVVKPESMIYTLSPVGPTPRPVEDDFTDLRIGSTVIIEADFLCGLSGTAFHKTKALSIEAIEIECVGPADVM
ncbi:hypothetical protein B0H11DRAFT_1927814 [Mycena galericulata]|nr:hypothetical protein B0H11DRAFT_1927814 [Mycena galericulata]